MMGSVRSRGSARFILSYSGPNGQRFRPTIEVGTKAEAERELKKREGALAHGRPLIASAEKMTFGDLTAGVIRDYQNNQKRSTGKVKKSVERLGEFFGGWRASNITAADVSAYIEKRLQAGFSNASINRELAVLKRAFNLAASDGDFSRDHIPRIRLLKEAAPRSGFFEREAFEAMRHHLSEPLKALVTVAYITGWRIRSEILPLQWRQVDLTAETLRLEPGSTKNGEGRMFVMTPDLKATLEAQQAMTDAVQRATGQIVPWVFHRKGKPIRSFRRAWLTACREAGVPGRIPHDFRRSAVRNFERVGISRSTAMKMIGHRTESVYRRYAIVNEGDLREAAMKLAAVDQARVNGAHILAQQPREPIQIQRPIEQDPVAGGPGRRPIHGRGAGQ